MNKKADYIKSYEGAERRYLTPELRKEIREETDGKLSSKLIGYAALFGTRTNLGWMEEEILPGAFDDVLQDDVRVLINHDPSLIVGRSNAGKGNCRLFVDDTGLGFELDVPDTTVGQDLLRNIELGNITQCSFGFTVKAEQWEKGENGAPDVRKVEKVARLFDVSPVTFPAYPDTTIAKRSYTAAYPEETQEPKKNNLGLAEARYKYLIIK